MSDHEDHLGDGLGVNTRITAGMGDEAVHDRVDDLDRQAQPGEPPVPGAQWDELHGRWERWDSDAEAWVVVGNSGDGVLPADENPLPSHLSRVTHLADELDAEPVPATPEHRRPEPGEAPKGAQWNEVVGRWERWDEATEAWIEAVDD